MSYDFTTWKDTWYATASEADRKLFRDWLTGVIRTERVNIHFLKADGTGRWLHCSLHPDLIPADKLQKEDATPRKRSEESLSVWDIDKQDWRSFRFDSIIQFSFNLGDLHV